MITSIQGLLTEATPLRAIIELDTDGDIIRSNLLEARDARADLFESGSIDRHG